MRRTRRSLVLDDSVTLDTIVATMAAPWTARLAEHPVQATFDQIEGLLTHDAFSSTTEAVEYGQRTKNVLGVVRRALGAADPELVPASTLDQLHAYAIQLETGLRTFVESGDASHLASVDNHVDSLLFSAAPAWAAATSPDAVVDVQQAVTSFRRSAGQLTSRLEEETRSLQAEVRRLTQQVQKRTTESEQEKARLDQAIATHQQQFSEAEAQRAAAFQQALTDGRAGLDGAATEGRAQLNDVVQRAEAALAGALEASQNQLQEQRDLQTERGGEFVEELEGLRDEAVRLVNVIGNTGLTGDYQRIANHEQVTANNWRLTAIVSLVAAALFNGVVLIFELWRDVEWSTILAVRLSITIPLLALFGYAIAESREHRRHERDARQMELQLASIGPYLAAFDDTKQQEIREQAFDRFFPGQPGAAELLARETGQRTT